MEGRLGDTGAVVVACRSSDPRFAGCADGLKSLIQVGARPALSHLVTGLKRSEGISSVIVVGDEAATSLATEADQRVSAASEAAAVMAGIRAADGADRCLVVAGDMPLVTPDAVEDLVTNAPPCDIVYPVTTHTDVEEAFPGRRTSYLKAKEGQVTGSTCLLVRREAVLARGAMLMPLLEARRNPSSLLGLVGVGLGLKLMFSTLSLVDFERHLSQALGLSCRVFITHYPELLFSLDTPEDVTVAEREISSR